MSAPSFWSKVGDTLSTVAVGAAAGFATWEAVDSTIRSGRTMVETGRTLVEREARLNGGSEVQALATVARHGAAAVVGYDQFQQRQSTIAWVGLAVVALILILFMARRS